MTGKDKKDVVKVSVKQAVPQTQQQLAYETYIKKCHTKASNSGIPAGVVLEMIDQLRVDLGKVPVSELPIDIRRVYQTGKEEVRKGVRHVFFAPGLIRAATYAQRG